MAAAASASRHAPPPSSVSPPYTCMPQLLIDTLRMGCPCLNSMKPFRLDSWSGVPNRNGPGNAGGSGGRLAAGGWAPVGGGGDGAPAVQSMASDLSAANFVHSSVKGCDGMTTPVAGNEQGPCR